MVHVLRIRRCILLRRPLKSHKPNMSRLFALVMSVALVRIAAALSAHSRACRVSNAIVDFSADVGGCRPSRRILSRHDSRRFRHHQGWCHAACVGDHRSAAAANVLSANRSSCAGGASYLPNDQSTTFYFSMLKPADPEQSFTLTNETNPSNEGTLLLSRSALFALRACQQLPISSNVVLRFQLVRSRCVRRAADGNKHDSSSDQNLTVLLCAALRRSRPTSSAQRTANTWDSASYHPTINRSTHALTVL
jgi:hypothetical protein